MGVQTIDRGTKGNNCDKFLLGAAFDTCQENDEYLDRAKTNVIETIAVLRGSSGLKTSCATLGYYSAGDGGHGEYILDVTDLSSSDNGFTVIVSADNKRWKLKQDNRGFYNVKQAGAKGDNSTDDTAALQLAITIANTYIPPGTYKITSTLVVDVAYRQIVGAGRGMTQIYQYGKDLDGIWVRSPNYYAVSDYLNGGLISDLTVACVASFSPMPTYGAGIRITQLNGHMLQRVSVSHFLEGLTYEGGQLNSAKTVNLSCNAGTYAGAGSALLHTKQSPIGGGTSYQKMYTLRLEDTFISATLLRDACARVSFADGLNIVNGYWGYGKNANLLFMNSVASDYVGGVNTEALYLDCVGAGSTLNGVEIRSNGIGTNFKDIQLGTGTFIGNGDGTGILSDYPYLILMLTGVKISGFPTGPAINVTGTNANTSVTMTGVLANNCGNTGGNGVCEFTSLRGLTMTGCMFRDNRQHIVRLSGTFNYASISGCVNTSPIDELISSATYQSNGLKLSGNTSNLLNSNMWAKEKVTIANLDFPNIAAGSSSSLTVTMSGCTISDFVEGCLSGATNLFTYGGGLIMFFYGITATDTVTVRAYNPSGVAIDLPPLDFNIKITKRR
jgi:hypothetical protein